MSDESVEALLVSDKSLVVIEAPAGCGKTFQGAKYARHAASNLNRGRVLILTHTHAACSVFAAETRRDAAKVEIRTIDSLITAIATAYHKSLDLPPDPAAWARQEGQDGFATLANRVATLLAAKPMISAALVDRFPVVIGDEHQDSSDDQHAIMMLLNQVGARLRVFGDPMQHIYRQGDANRAIDRARWEEFKGCGAFDVLDKPHRWSGGSTELGDWILAARKALERSEPINLNERLPASLNVLYAENIAPNVSGYRVTPEGRQEIDRIVNEGNPLLVLTGQNATAKSLRSFWNRRIPIWEGYTRQALDKLAISVFESNENAMAVARGVVEFLGEVAVGFNASSHGNRFLQEVEQNCSKPTRGKPAHLQEMARQILENPNHIGAAKCLAHLCKLREENTAGFDQISIDNHSELKDAICFADYASLNQAMKEIHRRRSFARPVPPQRAISTVHKAKGLQCENAIVMPCDRRHFGETNYARCKLYVALSRASRSLTLILPRDDPSPLFLI